MPQTNPRRYLAPLLVVFAIIAIIFFSSSHGNNGAASLEEPTFPKTVRPPAANANLEVQKETLSGGVIMSKLGNETAKAELGRSAWKLFHTIMARFPDKPSADEQTALKSYIHLFVRLYPCGECAEHFRQIVEKFPPQVSTRSTAAVWACHVHNEVNKSLKKEIFDCSNIGDFYDCGCAEDEKGEMNEKGEKSEKVAAGKMEQRDKPEMSDEAKERLSSNGREFSVDLVLAS